MIEIKELNHFYGRFQSLRRINLTIPRGGIAGFIGQNGAGKSTLLKILSGFLVPASGEVLLDGISLSDEPVQARRRIGYMPETPYLYREMRVEEYIDFVARLKGVPGGEWKREWEELTERCGLGVIRRKLIGSLSKGNRQRVALAQALVGHPTILLLDEPTSALDPGQVIEIRNFIRGLKGEATILMSSHVLSEIAQVCDQIVFIQSGEIRYHGA
ncbi:MAG: ABC transporter ATP-binding protein, partial [Deltaproteobacteria bacterium]|nr:ABC transporter ATP-binding protein [Deltaproteobacteria bacterium]